MMDSLSLPCSRRSADRLASLRGQLAAARRAGGPALAFGLAELDDRLADHGLDAQGLHEFAAASAALSDDAATTLFIAGIAARFLAASGAPMVWALTRFDLYAPGLEQAGLTPARIVYAQGSKDSEVLAMAEDGMRHGGLACVVAEVKAADLTATRRLQLAASDGRTPILLYRRHRTSKRCPLNPPSAAMTRWRIGCRPSAPLPVPGIGRGRWQVELVRQRGGNEFSLELEACDETGSLALPAAVADRATATVRAASQVA
jgi:protein ImuA